MDLQHHEAKARDSAPMPLASTPLFDPDALVHLEQLDEGARRSLINRIFAAFERSTEGLLTALQVAIKADDCESVRISAHTLKSGSGQVGATQMFERARQIEREAAAGEVDAGLIGSLRGCYAETLRAIASWRTMQ